MITNNLSVANQKPLTNSSSYSLAKLMQNQDINTALVSVKSMYQTLIDIRVMLGLYLANVKYLTLQ